MNFDRLYALIKEKGYSRSFVCAKIGKSTSYLSDCKAGKNTLQGEPLHLICELLETTVDYLEGNTDQKEKPADLGELIPGYNDLTDDAKKKVQEYIDLLLLQQNSK